MFGLLLMLSMSVAEAGKDPCSAGRIAGDGEALTAVFGSGDWQVTHQAGGTSYGTRLFISGSGSDLAIGFFMGVVLDDGTTFQLPLAERAEARTYTNETGTFTQWETTFTVDAETLAKFAGAPVTAVRVDVGKGPVVTPMAKGRAKKIHNAFQCIAAKVGP